MKWCVDDGDLEDIPDHIRDPKADDDTAEALAEQYFDDLGREARFPVHIIIVDDAGAVHPFDVEMEAVPQFHVVRYVSRQ